MGYGHREAGVLQKVRVHGEQHHIVAVGRRVAVQWRTKVSEFQALFLDDEGSGGWLWVQWIDHPQHPHLGPVSALVMPE